MKSTKYLFPIALVLGALASGAWAQTETASTSVQKKQHADTTTAHSVTAADLQKLQDGLAAAQQQIQALQEELRHRDQAVQQAQTTASDAAAKAEAAQSEARRDAQTVGELQSDVAGLKSVSATSLNNPVLDRKSVV